MDVATEKETFLPLNDRVPEFTHRRRPTEMPNEIVYDTILDVKKRDHRA